MASAQATKTRISQNLLWRNTIVGLPEDEASVQECRQDRSRREA
jgi:hypothetical protein